MAIQWFYSREGKEQGPVTSLELKELAAAGRIRATDHVWKEGMAEWVEAGRITGLFDANSTQPTGEVRPAAGTLAGTVAQGAGAAQSVVEQATALVRQNFGAAIGETMVEGTSSLKQLLTRPLRYAFVTTLFIVAVMLAAAGLFTLVLVPVFAMGYITVMKQIGENEPTSLRSFIDFLRHGWNSLWHLLMMLASFIVTIGAMIAPAVLVALLLYFTFGSIGAVVGQMVQFTSSGSGARHALPPGQGEGALGWVGNLLGKAGQTVVEIVAATAMALLVIVLCAPFVAAKILIFYLALDVAGSKADPAQPFNLVYDSFGRMLEVARARWKRLLMSSLYLPTLLVLGFVVLGLLMWMFNKLSLTVLGNYRVGSILMTLFLFGYIVYASVFVTRTCVAFHKQQSAAA